MANRRGFGDPGTTLTWWKAGGFTLTVLMLTSLGAVLWGIGSIGGQGGAEAWLATILGIGGVPGFGWLAVKAGNRVDELEGGLVQRKAKRPAMIAGFVVLLGAAAILWFWVFPWVDRTFVNRPAVGG